LLLFFMLAFFVKALRGEFSARCGANEYTPGSTAGGNLTPQVWAQEIEPAVYEERVITQRFKNLGKSGEQMHIRTLGPLSRTTPANSDPLLVGSLTWAIGADT